MSTEAELNKEQQIMRVMRKTLTNIARETVPDPGLPHPLSAQTIEEIRMCLSLISARERELSEARGIEHHDRPYFADAPQAHKVVSINQIKRSAKPKVEK